MMLTRFWLKQFAKQGRVAVLWAVVVCLFVLNGVVYSGKHREGQYRQDQNAREYIRELDSVRNNMYLSRASFLLAYPAQPLRFVADGKLEQLPSARAVNVQYDALPQTAQSGRTGFVEGLWTIDLVFIVGVILSFIALVLTFDSISGEREAGTLKLLLTTGASRTALAVSKILAAALMLAAPLLVGLLLNWAILLTAGVVKLAAEHTVVMCAFLALAVIVVFLFCALGVLISTLTRSPITSMVVCMLVWVLLVIVVPGMVKPAATALSNAKTPEQFSRTLRALDEAFQEDWRSSGAMDRQTELAMQDDFRYERVMDAVYERYQDNYNAAVAGHLNDLYSQATIARSLARLSPTAVFGLACARLCATDVNSLRVFNEQVSRYGDALFGFFTEQDYRDATSPHLLHTRFAEYLSKKDFTARPPRFVFQPEGIPERIAETMLDLVILFSLAMAATLGVVFAIDRYDVR